MYPGNLVYRCSLPDGTPAVVRSEPHRPGVDEFLTGVEALALYAGRGMARLLELDRDERIALIELVTPGEPTWSWPIERALRAAATVMRELRAPPPENSSFPNVRLYRRAWPKHRRLYGGPGAVDPDLFAMGEALYDELCDTSEPGVVLHGDLHYGNVLTSDRAGHLAIDPKGVVGEAAYETGDLLRNRVDELFETGDPGAAMRRRVEMLADLTGFDRERIRLWGLAQAVLSELWSLDDPSRPRRIDLRAARLLDQIGPLP